jgi:hypothetical protein
MYNQASDTLVSPYINIPHNVLDCDRFDKRHCQRLIHGYILKKCGWNSLKYLIAQEGLYYFPFNIRLLVIYLKYNQILGQIVPAVEIRIRIRKIFSLTNFSEWIFFLL